MRLHRRFTSIFFIAAFLLAACGNTLPTPPPVESTATSTSDVQLTPIDLPVGYGARGPWFELYFTDPANPASMQGTGGVDGPLVKAIDDGTINHRCGCLQYQPEQRAVCPDPRP